MAHTSGLQGRLTGCGCHGAPVNCKPFRGTPISIRKPPANSRIESQTQCAAVSNVKLPATHKEASQRALDQLRASSSIVNSTFPSAVAIGYQLRSYKICIITGLAPKLKLLLVEHSCGI